MIHYVDSCLVNSLTAVVLISFSSLWWCFIMLYRRRTLNFGRVWNWLDWKILFTGWHGKGPSPPSFSLSPLTSTILLLSFSFHSSPSPLLLLCSHSPILLLSVATPPLAFPPCGHSPSLLLVLCSLYKYYVNCDCPPHCRSITGLIIAFISTCVLMATGYACQLKYFFNTNFLINFR